MRSQFGRLFSLVTVIAVATLAGCNNDDDCDCPQAVETAVAVAKVPEVTGKWTGRWESETHKGHGGGLTCEAVESGKDKWEANFTAEFGKTKSYKVKLEGTPGDGKVVFGGKVDLGKDDGGEFTWTGRATETEFSGEYQSTEDKGSFKMTRAK
jgi:hypothetical protein